MDWLDLEDLLGRIALQDRGAFADLYTRTASTLLSVCRRVLRDPELAEDAVHETYIRVWRRSATFDPRRGAPIAWLVTIARRCAIDRLRQRHAGPETDEPLPDIGDEMAQLEATLLRSDIGNCLAAIGPEQRRALMVVYFGGLTHEQAASRMGVPLGTLKSWVRRGLLRMKDCLDQ